MKYSSMHDRNHDDPSQLPLSKQIVFKVQCFNLERFIKHHLGFIYEIADKEETRGWRRYSIDGELTQSLENDWVELVEAKDKPSYSLYLILQVLCHRKVIEPGEYMVEIDW